MPIRCREQPGCKRIRKFLQQFSGDKVFVTLLLIKHINLKLARCVNIAQLHHINPYHATLRERHFETGK